MVGDAVAPGPVGARDQPGAWSVSIVGISASR
jgi:hypothetical protein